MRFKATLVLGVILLLLGLYLFLVEIPKGESDAKKGARRLFTFQSPAIRGLTLYQPNGLISFEHDPDHPEAAWRIVQPFETVADDAAVSSLGFLLENIEYSRIVETTPSDLSPFGLVSPGYKLIIAFNPTDTKILEIGDDSVTGSEVYVRTGPGGPIYLVPATIKQAVKKELKEWRRRELFRFSPSNVKKIAMKSPLHVIEMGKEKEVWFIKNPISAMGDDAEIGSFLSKLTGLKGDDFIDQGKEEKKKGFGPPVLELNLTVGEMDRPATFYHQPPEPDILYAITTPDAPIYKISRESSAFLNQPVFAFRDKKVVSFSDVQEVAHILIHRTGAELRLEKKDETWFKKNEKVTSPDKVLNLLWDLHDMRVEAFLDDPIAALSQTGPPSVSVTLKGKGGNPLGEIIFGRVDGERVVAKSSRQPAPFFLKKESLDRILSEKDLTTSSSTPGPSNP